MDSIHKLIVSQCVELFELGRPVLLAQTEAVATASSDYAGLFRLLSPARCASNLQRRGARAFVWVLYWRSWRLGLHEKERAPFKALVQHRSVALEYILQLLEAFGFACTLLGASIAACNLSNVLC